MGAVSKALFALALFISTMSAAPAALAARYLSMGGLGGNDYRDTYMSVRVKFIENGSTSLYYKDSFGPDANSNLWYAPGGKSSIVSIEVFIEECDDPNTQICYYWMPTHSVYYKFTQFDYANLSTWEEATDVWSGCWYRSCPNPLAPVNTTSVFNLSLKFAAEGFTGSVEGTDITNHVTVTKIYPDDVWDNQVYWNPIDPRKDANLQWGWNYGGDGLRMGGNGHYYKNYFTGFVTSAAAPEPSQWALLVLGFAAVGTGLRARRGVAQMRGKAPR